MGAFNWIFSIGPIGLIGLCFSRITMATGVKSPGGILNTVKDMSLGQVMGAQDIVAYKDVAVVLLRRKIQSAKTPEEKERFEKELFDLFEGKNLVIESMRQIVTKCTDSNEFTQKILHGKSQAYGTKEYKEVAEYYKEKVFNWHEEKYRSAMDHLYLFANLLEEKVTVERIKSAIDEVGAAMRPEKEKENEMEQ